MARLSRIFFDSSGYFALANPRDSYYQAAQIALRRLSTERWSLFTTNFVIAETHAFFLARLGYRPAAFFLRQMSQTAATTLRVTKDDESRAHDIIYHYDDKAFYYTDATSFAIMERLDIGTAFTLDEHFVQYGFTVLPERRR